jgi:hypothetical protein
MEEMECMKRLWRCWSFRKNLGEQIVEGPGKGRGELTDRLGMLLH